MKKNRARPDLLSIAGTALLMISAILLLAALSHDLFGAGGGGFGNRQRMAVKNSAILFSVAAFLLLMSNFRGGVIAKFFSGDRRAVYEKVAGRIFISVVITALLFLLLDFIGKPFLPYRMSAIERRFPVDVTRRAKPYSMFGGTAYGKLLNNERLNRLGYRGKAPLPDKGLNEFRVFVLGGSSVFNGDPPIPELLEIAFRKNGFNNVSVFNFGVVSSISGMELTRILFEISDLCPDLIIMYNGNNDIDPPVYADPRPGYPFNFIVYENNPLVESDTGMYPAISLLLYGSNILRALCTSYFVNRFIPLERIRNEVEYGTPKWRDDLANEYVANLARASKLSKTFGADFIAFFQPTSFLRDFPYVYDGQKNYEKRKSHFIDVHEKILSGLNAAKVSNELRFFDLSDIYDTVPGRVFWDPCHTYQESKIVAADAIYRRIVDTVDIPK